MTSPNTSLIGFIACSSTNVTSSAYVQIQFGTLATNPTSFPNLPTSTSKIQITDTTGKIIKLAYILPGSPLLQTDFLVNDPNGSILINRYFAPGTALYVQAIDSTNNASSGYIVVSLIP